MVVDALVYAGGAGLEDMTKCTLHVMMHEPAATSTLTAAADKMKGTEYSFAPGSQDFQKSDAGSPPRSLARANSRDDVGTFPAMAASGSFLFHHNNYIHG